MSEPSWKTPDDRECERYWDMYAMPEHIRAHSRMVAKVSGYLAEQALKTGLEVCVQAVRASALLHDLAKDYTIRHSGNHSQLGASWVLDLTGNPLLAQGVMHHVFWPFEVDVAKYFLPLAVLYGDKRVIHERITPLDQRFQDLLARYGKTLEIHEKIIETKRQAKVIEQALGRLVKVDLSCACFS
ncbi:MAG: HD domain-containing protein [Desulfovibrionaceae bacterium]|nr:HD domain-containing protein [Desulfovibrionaceae bacterium]